MRAAAIVILLASPAASQFRTTSTLVVSPTTVTDAAGKYVDGLLPVHLILYDNGVPQTIQVDEAYNPLSLVVAIQTSANSSANLDKLGDAGILFTHLLAGERGETALVGYSDEVQLLQDFTTNPDRLAPCCENCMFRVMAPWRTMR